MSNEYLWFLTFEAINKNKLSLANNLPLGLFGIHYDYRDEEMEQAIKTAVSVWLKGLHQSFMASVTPDGTAGDLPWKLPNLDCQSKAELRWKDGHTFYQYLRNVTTDTVSFNELGQLKYKDIKIVNVQQSVPGEVEKKWREVGMFTSGGIHMKHITWPNGHTTPPTGKPKRHFLRIVTREEPPFVEYRDLSQNGSCGHFSYLCHVYDRDKNEFRISNTTVKRCCTGLSIDFLHRLSVALNFDFYLYEVEDYQWGNKNSDGNWDGIVGDLVHGKADMAVASMTIDEDRSTAINFSVPYMETGITFIVAIREGAISATAFLEPYDYPSWCLILVCSVHVTGASIFLFEWLSPYGLDHGRKLSPTYKFSLFRTFWLMWAMLFGAAVTTDTPRGVSSKFMSNIWALFALVFSASYTANLAAFMITKEEYYDLSGMQDWRLQKPYAMNPPFRFATIANGTTESNIKKNNANMYEYMKKYTQRSVEQAMESLKTQTLHAFIYDASVLKYQEGKDKDCRLITVGNWYATTGYGVGFPFKSPWLDRVNNVILNLQYEGEMERLKEFWLAGACHTKRKKTNNNRGIGNGVSSSTLGILNFTSAFILLAAGTGLAVLTLILEQCYFCFARKRLRSWDKKGCCALVSLVGEVGVLSACQVPGNGRTATGQMPDSYRTNAGPRLDSC
ncbi:glutamate receptor ionotropic, NMDA 2B-like [Physella acuta]|uniref:glutamate receptor ionotropic, NMDA 2B-like n=1 Tax=Physella acuta TaxID=109671 RepID=UPI0027DC0EB8|nr:glutamate receptor ionotropic, NMDA 2B-like [Physella acuta]